MSAHGVAEKVVELLKKGEFIMCNFAPPDMVRIFRSLSAYLLCIEDIIRVGHTGIYDAAVEAISGTDGTIAKAANEKLQRKQATSSLSLPITETPSK